MTHGSRHSKGAWAALLTAIVLLLLDGGLELAGWRARAANDRAERAEEAERKISQELLLSEIRSVDRALGDMANRVVDVQEYIATNDARWIAVERRLSRVEAIVEQMGQHP